MMLVAILMNDTKVTLENVVKFIFFAENRELCYEFKGEGILKTMDNVRTLESEEK